MVVASALRKRTGCVCVLDLSNGRIGPDGVAALCVVLEEAQMERTAAAGAEAPCLNDLQEMRLDGNPVRAKGAGSLADFLSTCHSVRVLSLRFCDLHSAGASALASGLRGNRCLETLDLSGNDIDDEAVDALSNGMAEAAQLRRVNFSRNCIAKQTSLRLLIAAAAKVPDVPLATAAAVVVASKGSALERIDLFGNPIHKVGWDRGDFDGEDPSTEELYRVLLLALALNTRRRVRAEQKEAE